MIYLYSSQNFVKLRWCENCDRITVASINCFGFKIGEIVIVKSCRSFPI